MTVKVLILWLLSLLTLSAQDVECLVVSGSFNESSGIWAQRWSDYGTNRTVVSGLAEDRAGCYVLQPYRINGRKCYRQLIGSNVIWYGHKLNPYSSYDAWYIGSYPYIDPPRVRRSIPCTPAFVPNRNGIATYDAFIDTNVVVVSAGDPSVVRVYRSRSSLLAEGYEPPGCRIKDITIRDGTFTLYWMGSSNHVYALYSTTNLFERFTLLKDNIQVLNGLGVWQIPFDGTVGFYKIVEY